MFIEKTAQGQGKMDMGKAALWDLGRRTYHWSNQGKGAPSRCFGVCWSHGTLVSQSEEAGPPTCWLCPYDQYSSELCTGSPLQWRCMKERHKQTREKRRKGGVSRTNSNTITHQTGFDRVKEAETGVNKDKRGWEKFTAISDSHTLTLGPLAFAGGPQVEQCRALLQQRVGILHTDLIDVIHTELKLACQLCVENKSEKIKQVREIFVSFHLWVMPFCVHSLALEMAHGFTVALSTRGRIVCQTAIALGRKTENN